MIPHTPCLSAKKHFFNNRYTSNKKVHFEENLITSMKKSKLKRVNFMKEIIYKSKQNT